VLSVFGDIQEDISKRAKYAKWKAIYISRCLKNGETPVPGPVAGTDADEFEAYGNTQYNENTTDDSYANLSKPSASHTSETVTPNSVPLSTPDFSSNVAQSPISAMSI